MATACRGDSPPHIAADGRVDSVASALERATRSPMVPGNAVELLENGRVFDSLEKDIRSARRSIHILVYIWRGNEADGASARVSAAVLARPAGVDCRILIDPVGSNKFDEETERQLTRSGCEIRRYDRGGLPAPLARNHRKIMVVDGRVGITGGFGIWKVWQGDGRSRDEWRDTAARARGPVVAQLQRAFEQSWREAGGPALPSAAYPTLARAGPYRAAFVPSSPRGEGPSAARSMAHLMVNAARKWLWIANSYFIPDEELMSDLTAQAKRGVDVRVLVPGPIHDVPPVRAAQRASYDSLLAAGIRIFEYQPSMMHAKTMVVDGRYLVVGSTNIDSLSFNHLEEGSLVVDAPGLARKLAHRLRQDFRRSDEVLQKEWKKQPPLPEIGRESAKMISDWL